MARKREPWLEAGMARSSPTALVLAGPLGLHSYPILTLFCQGAVTWLRALNIIVFHPSNLGKQGKEVKRTEA